MALIATESKPFETNIPEGQYSAVCVGLYDIGTVHNKKYNKDVPQVLFVWELVDLRNAEGFNETIQQQYTPSLGEKSNLRRMLVSWRGRQFTPDELATFDLKKVLGAACQLLVVHNKVEKNVYANIASIFGWPKSLPAPKPRSNLTVFEFGVHTEVPHGTPEWVKDKIESSPEWPSRFDMVQGMQAAQHQAPAPAQAQHYQPTPLPAVQPTTNPLTAAIDRGPGVNEASIAQATSAQSAEEMAADDSDTPF